MERENGESGRLKQKRRGLWIQLNNLKWNADTFPEPSFKTLFIHHPNHDQVNLTGS